MKMKDIHGFYFTKLKSKSIRKGKDVKYQRQSCSSFKDRDCCRDTFQLPN